MLQSSNASVKNGPTSLFAIFAKVHLMRRACALSVHQLQPGDIFAGNFATWSLRKFISTV